MFGSRGKGSRRRPWRDGGAGKSPYPQWHKQAAHAVWTKEELGEPLAALHYSGSWGQSPSKRIYKFDQKIAPTKIRYFAEFSNASWRAPFTIWVHQDHASTVQKLIGELEAGE